MEKQTIPYLIIFTILFGIWLLAGYLVIMCTRLFTFPTKKPPFSLCLIVGFTAFMMVFMHTDWFKSEKDFQKSPTNELGYEYEIEKNKLTFSIPPTKEEGIQIKFNDLAPWKLRRQPLYTIGNIDGKNNTFYISATKDKITNHELFKEHGYYLRICRGKNPEKLDSEFPYKRKYYYNNAELWEFYLPLIAIICIIASHLKAITEWINATNNRTNMGQV